jgi:hypothetical protein
LAAIRRRTGNARITPGFWGVEQRRTDSILNRLVVYFLGYAEVLKLVIYEMNALGILYLVNSFECF